MSVQGFVFEKRPEVVEAIQYTGYGSVDSVKKFVESRGGEFKEKGKRGCVYATIYNDILSYSQWWDLTKGEWVVFLDGSWIVFRDGDFKKRYRNVG